MIEHPKVFISYAWTSDEYKNKVLAFATQLVRDGVDVLLDQFDLIPGNDMNGFMEKSVTDPSVTNVLILLNPEYQKKADARTGGVGTETQIISPEVYGKTDQTKFIPVAFERDKDGSIKKPAYLKGRLYFDLSKPEKYEKEYKDLVTRLYGLKTTQKPKLGDRPAWLGQPDDNVSTGNDTKEIPYLKEAEMGSPNAQTGLGIAYYYGQGVPQDYAEAVKWFRRAAIQGNSTAQVNLGICYYNGQGVEQDYIEGIKWHRMAAENGNPYGQNCLGYDYFEGKGIPQDYAEAVKWYRKAAIQGYASAQINLGGCYYNGQGIEQDYTEAVKWYRKAADQGNPFACYRLADCYVNGLGVTKDLQEAEKWRKKAREKE